MWLGEGCDQGNPGIGYVWSEVGVRSSVRIGVRVR